MKYWLLLGIVAWQHDAIAKPSWAGKSDSAGGDGHTFICEGSGRSEDDAFNAAQSLCNDKVCKVCGVEIESVVETRETLRGVDMQRKVIERCRRVRKGESRVQYKSTDCGPDGCTAWIQIFYSKDDERAECLAYAQESFADPAACEKDIEDFKKTPGRDAESFRKRQKILTDALAHCDKIDVRPTPAILALNEKLLAGMDAFEFTDRKQQTELETPFFDSTWYRSRQDMMDNRSTANWYLTTFAPLRQDIAESKFLTDRIRLVRDYVANRALVFDVIEAVNSRELDTPSGMARFATTLGKVPVGAQYGSPNVAFASVSALYRAKSDTSAVTAYMRKTYPAEGLEPGQAFTLAKVFADDKKVTGDEWDYVFKAHRAQAAKNSGYGCPHCLRTLIAVPEHGAADKRLERVLLALANLKLDKDTPKDRRRALMEVVPLNEPGFTVALESKLPEVWRVAYDLDLYRELVSRLDYPPIPKEAAPLYAQVLRFIVAGPKGRDGKPLSRCQELAQSLDSLKKYHIDLAPVDGLICECLGGELAREHLGYSLKWDLFHLALERRLACVQ